MKTLDSYGISEKTQEEMIAFFMRTSIPRLIEAEKQKRKADEEDD